MVSSCIVEKSHLNKGDDDDDNDDGDGEKEEKEDGVKFSEI